MTWMLFVVWSQQRTPITDKYSGGLLNHPQWIRRWAERGDKRAVVIQTLIDWLMKKTGSQSPRIPPHHYRGISVPCRHSSISSQNKQVTLLIPGNLKLLTDLRPKSISRRRHCSSEVDVRAPVGNVGTSRSEGRLRLRLVCDKELYVYVVELTLSIISCIQDRCFLSLHIWT